MQGITPGDVMINATVKLPSVQNHAPGTMIPSRSVRSVFSATVLASAACLAFLAILASQQAYSYTDLRIAQWVRGLEFPGLHTVLSTVNVLTDAHMAIILWIMAGAFFVLRSRPLEAIAVFAISGLWVGDALISVIVSRPAPPIEMQSVVGFSLGSTFPSGHITGAVAFYGLLTFLTLNNLSKGHLRVIVPALSLLITGLASVGRVYVSAHWPSDILGSYLFALIGVVVIATVYTRVKEDRFHMPSLRKKQPETVPSGVKIARSIASIVYLNEAVGTATKQYRPPSVVRALHRLAFQAPFAYQRNKAALEAAAAKRKIAGLLTRHQYGQDMVAPVLEIRSVVGGNYQFITEFIPGVEPDSNHEISDTLADLYGYFQETGLPTWQIAPATPTPTRTLYGHLRAS